MGGVPGVPPGLQSPELAAPPKAGGHAHFNLRQRFLKGSFWTACGQIGTQGLRFASNLILTHLLAPGDFGLMVMAMVVITGAEMLTGIGTLGSIISNKRGEERMFLNTVWTTKAIRGLVLTLIVALIAYPWSLLYQRPALFPIIAALSGILAIRGFESTARFTLVRRMQPRWTITMDLKAELIGFATTVVLAYVWRSLWAMVVGALVKEVVRAGLSHRLIPGYRVTFGYDRVIAGELYRFGRWIMLSSAVAFLVLQGDKLVLGKYLKDDAILGLYAVAILIPAAIDTVLVQMNTQVLQPMYAKLKDRDKWSLRRAVLRGRGVMLALFLPVAWGLAVGGDWVVKVLYDPRWLDAGWMLMLLGVAMVPRIVALSSDGVLLARGDSYRQMLLQIVRAVLLVGAMAVGLSADGLRGMLIGLTVARVVEYPVLVALIRRYGVWLPGLDAAALAASAAVIGGGWWVRSVIGI